MVDGIREQPGLAQRIHMDIPLLLGLLALASVGLVVMYSVDGGEGHPSGHGEERAEFGDRNAEHGPERPSDGHRQSEG